MCGDVVMCMSWDWCVWRCGDVYELGLVCVEMW